MDNLGNLRCHHPGINFEQKPWCTHPGINCIPAGTDAVTLGYCHLTCFIQGYPGVTRYKFLLQAACHTLEHGMHVKVRIQQYCMEGYRFLADGTRFFPREARRLVEESIHASSLDCSKTNVTVIHSIIIMYRCEHNIDNSCMHKVWVNQDLLLRTLL